VRAGRHEFLIDEPDAVADVATGPGQFTLAPLAAS
jgi:hypothetical protein